MRVQRVVRPTPIDRAPLEPATVEHPRPGADEIVIEVGACAVCRTDLQIAEGEVRVPRLPIVPGHQAVGRVVAVGSDVGDWHVGDRAAAAWLGSACGRCARCRSGRENLCEEARFTGLDRDGGYAQALAVRADFALRIPDRFDDEHAAPLLCGGVIGYRALRLSGIQPGGRIGLFGFGASARLAIQVARHWGCDPIVVTRSGEGRREALGLGASWAGSYEETAPVLDAAVTFSPSGDAIVAALRSLDRGATVAVNAIHLDRVPSFPYELLWWERGVRSVANFTRQDAREFLDLAARIPIETRVARYPLADANLALRAVASGEADGTAVLMP